MYVSPGSQLEKPIWWDNFFKHGTRVIVELFEQLHFLKNDGLMKHEFSNYSPACLTGESSQLVLHRHSGVNFEFEYVSPLKV